MLVDCPCGATVKLRGPKAEPGAVVRFTCPTCETSRNALAPGNQEADAVVGKFNDLVRRFENLKCE